MELLSSHPFMTPLALFHLAITVLEHQSYFRSTNLLFFVKLFHVRNVTQRENKDISHLETWFCGYKERASIVKQCYERAVLVRLSTHLFDLILSQRERASSHRNWAGMAD